MSKPTIILCSGAWHTDFHIAPVVPHFENAGYRIIPCPLASAGSSANEEQTIASIQSTAEQELSAGSGVCLIVHSAAGRIGTEAINRVLANTSSFSGKITRVLYLGTFIDWEPLIIHLMANDLIDIDAEKGTTTFKSPKKSFYDDLSDVEAKPFIDALTWQNGGTYELSSEAWMTLPRTFVICLKDQSVPVEMQEATAKQYGMDVVRADFGHCPFTTVPEEFVKVVDGILR